MGAQHVDRYCVANEEVAFRLADRGVPREKISVTGIPVMPQFSAPLDRATCARELGLEPNKFTVLMMAGGAGVGGLDKLAERVLRLPDAPQLVALAGRNAELLQRLQALASKHPGKLFPLGFTTTVERVMTAADLVVTKPGGLSVSECLAKQRAHAAGFARFPGQEERNADYLLEVRRRHQGRRWRDARIQARAACWPSRRACGHERGRARIGRPDAAADVVALISSSP